MKLLVGGGGGRRHIFMDNQSTSKCSPIPARVVSSPIPARFVSFSSLEVFKISPKFRKFQCEEKSEIYYSRLIFAVVYVAYLLLNRCIVI
jgi:hypothetical protein